MAAPKKKNTYRKKPNGKNATGRPSKYDPQYCEDLIEWMQVDPYTTKNGKRIPEPLPTFEKFAANIGVCHDTLREWVKVHPEFSESYKKAKELQFSVYITNAMLGLYPPAFACFFGKNFYGLVDKVDHEHSGPGGGPILMANTPPAFKTIEEWEKWKVSQEKHRMSKKAITGGDGE
jgi:hypothetical protein